MSGITDTAASLDCLGVVKPFLMLLLALSCTSLCVSCRRKKLYSFKFLFSNFHAKFDNDHLVMANHVLPARVEITSSTRKAHDWLNWTKEACSDRVIDDFFYYDPFVTFVILEE